MNVALECGSLLPLGPKRCRGTALQSGKLLQRLFRKRCQLARRAEIVNLDTTQARRSAEPSVLFVDHRQLRGERLNTRRPKEMIVREINSD